MFTGSSRRRRPAPRSPCLAACSASVARATTTGRAAPRATGRFRMPGCWRRSRRSTRPTGASMARGASTPSYGWPRTSASDASAWRLMRQAQISGLVKLAHLGGLALARRRPGRIQPSHRRLGDGRPHALPARRRRVADGLGAPSPRARPDPSQRPKAASSSLWPSASRPATLASPSRWGAAAIASTMPSQRASSRPSRRSSSAGAPTRRELTGEVFDYIEAFYNPVRRHSTLDYLSPTEFELRATRSEHETMKIKEQVT